MPRSNYTPVEKRSNLDSCARKFDDFLPYCCVSYDPRPRPSSFDEALKGFLESDSSDVAIGNRFIFVDGKAAFLMEMWSIDQTKTVETIRNIILNSFQTTDSLTQNCLVSIMKHHPSIDWSLTLEDAVRLAPWWRVRRGAISALESAAEHEGTFKPLKEFLGGLIAAGVADESEQVREELLRCFAKACSVCRSGDLIPLMSTNAMPKSRAAVAEVRRSLAQSSTVELSRAIAAIQSWDWISVAVEALYCQSETKLPLPAYVSQLVKAKLIKPSNNLLAPSAIHHELLACILSGETPQRRGLRFEALLNRLLSAVNCSIRRSYSLPGEQLDGMIEHRGIYYLVEAKWTSGPVSAAAVGAFRDKVEARIRGTRGVFVAIAGYTSNALRTIQRGKMQSVILLDGNDVYYAFTQPNRFRELLDSKVQSAASDGAIYSPIPLRSLITA